MDGVLNKASSLTTLVPQPISQLSTYKFQWLLVQVYVNFPFVLAFSRETESVQGQSPLLIVI